ncbi:type II toxin-antitoxin system RelE/ParE family toxin [Candidatus Thioglobus sp.]|jgi:proteic killer suppression protein|uniref:type II toxin-antitoxin system RelE/ParE family toxin n=1 Tax=Candidatus Thioglobus sp. TaxID=2026721 RepID=UPI001DF22B5B|nr:type II toxin-antitoxin system RelE/ParE family toxin [Candidatus Thioglobus sp.]MBT3277037.1 type II toxin-antitoxin system RelE/ParE family toxin [Candidatus Thioglobus sp.]MBT4422430.1 type II toxin-antitoxin system RelE/ParE family toxin [Candidatus Thioglobus sp.]MBT5286810.1 type II toxin-antitoxin system RelE/ParE family toxin [Candidatus Thioglobus sp.]MBT6279401.1 type II toxin-antitoxin system RelE/ParE family toxin [Candidatus Thioglobus sp.]MBT6359730.1 type II toxin-antitoxin s
MIKSYADKKTEKFATDGNHKSIPGQISRRALMRLIQIDNATCLDDLRLPSSNHLENLSGNRKGQSSVRINQQYRVCFIFKGSNSYDIEIIDYH